jgi:hypothetical protein
MTFDARFKLLLMLFFREFIELFFPDFFDSIDWDAPIEFLDKELTTLLPATAGQCVDLLVKVRSRVPPRPRVTSWLCLIHAEVEARRSRRALGKRMCGYFHRIDEKLDLPTVPIALYIHVGGDGLGWQSYDMSCWGHCFNHFEFPYIGLPALDGCVYAERPNPVAWALCGLMRIPPAERARIKAESLRRAARMLRDERKRLVVVECVECFLPLDRHQQEEFDQLVQSAAYQEVRTMQQTTYEKGIEQGREEGQRETLLLLLEERFGTLPQRIRKRIERMPAAERANLLRNLFHVTALKDLNL